MIFRALYKALLLELVISTLVAGARQQLGNRQEESSSQTKIAAAWYAGWHAEDFPLSAVSWKKYTILTYAFATTTPNAGTISLEPSDKAFLPKFVSTAHQNNVKASLSIGGWTGSRFFSSHVGSPANRTAFVNAVTKLVKQYTLDGIDFDWEYPNRQGIGCNHVNPNDTSNFLAFLQELRAHPLGSNLTLSAATSIQPFTNSNGQSADVSPFSQVLDYIAIMNYDIWSSWSNGVGPNAPLNDTCVMGDDRNGSAVSSVMAWSEAGMPKSKLVLGVPSYGHSFAVDPGSAFDGGSQSSDGNLKAFPRFNASRQPHGDRWDGDAGTDVCGNVVGPGGVYTFWGLMEGGFLDADGTVKSGVASRFDDCSQTPYVYNATSGVMVSYDNARSFAAKGEFIRSSGLAGFAMWEAGGDSGDILLSSIRSAMLNGNSSLSQGGSSAGSPASKSSTANSADGGGVRPGWVFSVLGLLVGLILL